MQPCATLCNLVQANRATSESNCMSFLSGPSTLHNRKTGHFLLTSPVLWCISRGPNNHFVINNVKETRRQPDGPLPRGLSVSGPVTLSPQQSSSLSLVNVWMDQTLLHDQQGGGRNQSPGSPPPCKEFILVSFYPLNIHLTSYTLQREKKKCPKM